VDWHLESTARNTRGVGERKENDRSYRHRN
jgi:hypothetical protein